MSITAFRILLSLLEERRTGSDILANIEAIDEAQRRDVVGLVLADGMKLVVVGVGLGLAAALALTRLISSMLFGVGAADVATFVGVASILGSVALLACYVPARRHTKVDPLIALRAE